MENKIYFCTKTDANGNRYFLTVDLEKRRIYRDYNLNKYKDDCIVLNSRRELNKATELFENAGFTRTIKL